MKYNYTYIKNRKCLQCLDPISDQTHALRKFCERVKLDDGSVLSCKDDYHSIKRKKEKAPFKNFAAHHEKMRNRVRLLLDKYGEIVNIDLINRFGIMLNRPAEIEWAKDGSQIFYFIEYAIIKINQTQFKIFKHDRIF